MKRFEFLYRIRETESFNAETIEEACKMFIDKHKGEDIDLDYEVEDETGEMIDISSISATKHLL